MPATVLLPSARFCKVRLPRLKGSSCQDRAVELRRCRDQDSGDRAWQHECTIGLIDRNGEVHEAKRSGGRTASRLFRSGVQSDVQVGRRIEVRVFGQQELQGLVGTPSDHLGYSAGQMGSEWGEVVTKEGDVLEQLTTATCGNELTGLG